MKKITLAIALATCVALTGNASVSVNWSYGGNLRDFDATIQAGWWVQLYQDVGGNGLSGITFDRGGIAGGATGTGDQLPAGAQFHTTTTSLRSGGVNWSEVGLDWTSLAGSKVYTVLFDSSSIATANRAVIIDSTASEKTLIADGPDDYTPSSVTGQWQTLVPEPGTVTMMLVGGCVIAMRKKLMRR